MGWIGCVRCEKFRCDFVAKTFVLIAPVQPVLPQALCSNETLQNAPKHYEMQQYISLGSNGVGRVHSLRKIPKQLHGTNLCFNCVQPILPRVFCSNETLPNAPKHYEMHQNMSLWSYGVDRVRSFFQKFWSDFVAWTFALIAPVEPILHRVSCSNEMIPNPPRHYETHQNMSLR